MNSLSTLAQITVPVDVPRISLDSGAIATLLNVSFTVIGGLAVLFLLVGAVRYVTGNGDQNQINQAKNTILYAVIGIVVSLMGFAIVQFVIGVLQV